MIITMGLVGSLITRGLGSVEITSAGSVVGGGVGLRPLVYKPTELKAKSSVFLCWVEVVVRKNQTELFPISIVEKAVTVIPLAIRILSNETKKLLFPILFQESMSLEKEFSVKSLEFITLSQVGLILEPTIYLHTLLIIEQKPLIEVKWKE